MWSPVIPKKKRDFPSFTKVSRLRTVLMVRAEAITMYVGCPCCSPVYRDGPCSHRQSFMMKAIIPSKDGGIKTITSIPSGVDSNGVFVLDVSMPLGNRRPRNFPPTKKDQADAHCRVTNASHNSGIETYFLKTEMRQQQKRAMLFSIRRY